MTRDDTMDTPLLEPDGVHPDSEYAESVNPLHVDSLIELSQVEAVSSCVLRPYTVMVYVSGG